MAYSFDSLGYAKRLRERGVPNDQAEAYAEAARNFLISELATKADVFVIKTDLLAMEQRLRSEFRAGIFKRSCVRVSPSFVPITIR